MVYDPVTLVSMDVTDGQVVRAGVSVTRNVMSCSGGHEFESRSGRTWDALYFCPKLRVLELKKIFLFKYKMAKANLIVSVK